MLHFLKKSPSKTRFNLISFYLHNKELRIAPDLILSKMRSSISMRQKLIIFIFILTLSISGYSQINVGLRGGFGASSSSTELVTGMKRKIGTKPTFGIIASYNLDLNFAAGLELNYTQFQERLDYSAEFSPLPIDFANPAFTEYSVNYLQIPIFGRVTFGEKKRKWFLTFGPYIGIGLSGKWNNYPSAPLNGSYILFEEDTSVNAKFKQGDFNRVDIGGILGGGIQQKIGTNGVLFLEARIQIGFLDFFNKQFSLQNRAYATSEYIKPSASWRAANISIGYQHTFKLPKKTGSAAVKKAGKQR